MLTALTRGISPGFGDCQLTFFQRTAIDIDVARRQHRDYEAALEACGASVIHVADDPLLADCVFVEDIAIVLDEIAVMTRPGAEERRPEGGALEPVLAKYRKLARILAPGTLDGGDVLLLDKTLYLGISGRSDASGRSQLRAILEPIGYSVKDVPFVGSLHLKSNVTRVSEDSILINPSRVDPSHFAPWKTIDLDPSEPQAANALYLPNGTIYPSHFPKTEAILRAAGIALVIVDASETAKAEGAVTCCSLIFSASP